MDEEVKKSIMAELASFEKNFNETIADLKKDSLDIKKALLGNEEFGTVGFKQRIESVEQDINLIKTNTASEMAILKIAIADLAIKKDIKLLIGVVVSVLATSSIAWLLTHLLK